MKKALFYTEPFLCLNVRISPISIVIASVAVTVSHIPVRLKRTERTYAKGTTIIRPRSIEMICAGSGIFTEVKNVENKILIPTKGRLVKYNCKPVSAII